MRTPVRWLVLVVLALVTLGCQDRRKDEIPTKIEPPPKQQPQAGGEHTSP